MKRMYTLSMALIIAGAAVLAGMPGQATAQEAAAAGAPSAEALGWQLGCQAYTFNRFTFYEAVDKVASLGLHYIEAYPGQRLSPDMPEDVKFDHNMPADLQKTVLDKLAAANVKLVNYGVVGLSNNEEESRKVFEFAKAMGIETICSEPAKAAFDLLEKLADEYEINVALHNHPKPSVYWSPDRVLEALEGRSKRLGACADTGHWMRSGIDPLEGLKKLEGRIISFHFKDLNEMSPRAHDVPWGTGKANVKALLEEIHRQGFKGVFSAEYEHNWENSLPDLAECVKNFEAIAAEILAKQ